MSNGNLDMWQWPRNEAGKVIGWTVNGRELENKSVQAENANLTTLAGIVPGAAGQAILAHTSKDATNDYLGVIQNVATNFGAVGDGVTNNSTVFGTAKAAGGLVFIPKPATGYNFTTAVGSTDAVSAWLPDPSQTWAQLTDSGQFSLWRGRSTSSIPTGSNIWRFSDRAFFGYAASAFAGDQHVTSDGGNSWCGNTSVPSYVAKNAGVLFMSGLGDTTVPARNQPYGFVSCTRSSDLGGAGPISFASATVADAAGITCWGGIQELQRESGAGNLYGWEIAAKNKGQGTNVATPNTLAAGGPSGVYGIWLHAAGHEDFGGVPVPCTAGIAFVSSTGPTITGSWNSGIVFASDAITNGEAVAMSSQPTFGASHRVNWYNQAGNIVFAVTSSATDADPWTLDRINTGLQISQSSVTVALFQTVASGVNYLGVTPGPTTAGPLLSALGTDTNISGRLRGKGTGGWIFQDGAAATKFQYNTTGAGFFGTTPIAKPTVSGAKGGNVALSSLVTQLANLGLIIDGTS